MAHLHRRSVGRQRGKLASLIANAGALAGAALLYSWARNGHAVVLHEWLIRQPGFSPVLIAHADARVRQG
ncbi:MAG: hypothetical protein ABI222_15710 [Opitutaceae bacterium]